MMIRAKHIIPAAIVAAFATGVTATAAIDITLRERVTTAGALVRLGDVAEIVAADRERARKLAALPLMPAPAPNTERFLQEREIEDLLTGHGVDAHELRFSGAAQVAIVAVGDGWQSRKQTSAIAVSKPMNRHAAVLAGKSATHSVAAVDAERTAELHHDVRQIIGSYLNGQAGNPGAWRVACDIADRHLALLEAATTPLRCHGGARPWIGRQRFIVSFATAQGMVRIPIYAEVSTASSPVVVAVRPIARGDVVTAAHLELRSVDHVPQASDRRAAVDSIEKLIGMEARQAIQAGEIVFTDQVQPPVLVKRGDVVTVSSQAGGIRVRTTARARQNGARGELVELESLETRQRFDARVVGLRETIVLAAGRPPAAAPSGRIDTAWR